MSSGVPDYFGDDPALGEEAFAAVRTFEAASASSGSYWGSGSPSMASAMPGDFARSQPAGNSLTAAGGAALRAVSVGPCLVRGGAEQWLIYLARFLNPRRLRLVRAIATNAKYVDPSFCEDLPVPVEVGGAREVRQAAGECDVLIGWGLPLDELLGEARPPLCIYVAHGDGLWTHDRLERSRRSVDHVVAVSRRVADRVCGGFPVSIIHNGVDSARLGQSRPQSAMRAALGFAPGDFVLGYLGRFSAEKRIDQLIRAVALLPAGFKLLLVGWGAQRSALMDLANDLIPGRYAFANASRYLGDYYRTMDTFCLVSDQEGYSLALLEAMMCQRPVIVTAVGSVPEIITDRVNGLIVSGTPESIAEAARRLHTHRRWARAVAREGHAYAEEHGHAARMAGQYEQLLERLWRQKSPAP